MLGAWPPLAGFADSVARATDLPRGWVSLSGALSSVSPVQPLLRLLEGSDQISTGSDGRLTVLLLGSDSRGSAVGLTDTIMIVSIKGNTISAASIPRDTLHIANPDGGTFSGRANAILETLARGRTVDEALAKFEVVIEQLLQIEVDYYAMVKFAGFDNLVRQVQPVTVDISRPIRDPKFWDDPGKPSGVYFPAAHNYQLWAAQPDSNPPLCNGLWRTQSPPIDPRYWCRRALPYVRSRKGSGNSDFTRARRQQDFVMATIRRVLQRGSGSALGALVTSAGTQQGARLLYTDIPLTTPTALDLYQTLVGSTVGFQVVFSPPAYAHHVSGSTAYQIDVSAVRAVTREWFGGGPGIPGATPSATPSPGQAASPSPSASQQPSIAAPTPTASQPLPAGSGAPASALPGPPSGGGLIASGSDLALVALIVGLVALIAVIVVLMVRRQRSTRWH